MRPAIGRIKLQRMRIPNETPQWSAMFRKLRTSHRMFYVQFTRHSPTPGSIATVAHSKQPAAVERVYNRAMRVLLLNLYYPPDTSATAKMAETVVNALAGENDVAILCGLPSYDPSERRSWKLFRTEEKGNVRIVRVGS